MNDFPGNDNADRHGIRGLFNPQSNPQTMMSCATSAFFGSPRGLVSCCKTNARYSDKGEVGGSSPPRPTIEIEIPKPAFEPRSPKQLPDPACSLGRNPANCSLAMNLI